MCVSLNTLTKIVLVNLTLAREFPTRLVKGIIVGGPNPNRDAKLPKTAQQTDPYPHEWAMQYV